MYGGTVATITVWGMGLPEIAAVVTAIVALLGAAVNLWYVINKNRRAEEAHRLEMEILARGATVSHANDAEEDS